MNELTSFTDILSDEIEISQPISLPSSPSSLEIRENVTSSNNNANVISRPAKRTGQYGEFRSVEEIDSKYRNVFSHSFFNVVQSRVIDDALYSDKSVVICAPTGSGKTVIFEMAIVQLLMSLDDKQYTGDFKIIYMAPVKALCTERLSEWYPKFTRLGLLCIEVTGDTDVDFSQLKPYRIIITTPEKWDMLTRRWRDHKSLVEVIKLFLIDEVHILNDEMRGPVLEAVVSRMKTIESSVQSSHRIEQIQKKCEGIEVSGDAPRIRFVAVSATVSNPEDVAAWLGADDKPAVFYKFGDECRPVKLNRIVEGYPCAEGTSIFKFDIVLNYKLWPIIQKYHDGKPTLIFCNTRKSVVLTAEALSKELTINFNPEQKARLVALASTMKNKKLQSLIMSGVGCHHAGMLFEERMNIEQSFRNRDLPILITTTTLAMGVNLPAHLVIIKNTQQYVNGAYQEYSISTVLQMVGRAGRPQFDTEATAVIMTRLADKHRYQALVGGNEPLQSFLHKRLTENLNSEAALGTVCDVAQCVQWLRSTFLFVRAARDPRRYLGLPPSAPQPLISKKIEELCVKAMNGLATSGLITMDEASCIESTDAGRLMSIYYLDVETMKNIMKIDGTENLERLLILVCESHELSDMHLRVDERRYLNALNRNNTAATIRFPMKGKISTRQMKLNCMIQAVLGCLPIPDPSLNQEAMKVMRIADRICKCLVAYVTRQDLVSQQPQYFSAVLNSIVLAKCVTAHLWENSPFVSKQLKGIGPAFSALLAAAGKVNFTLLEESHPRDLERIMNKGPPAGNTLRKQISFLPKYDLTITPKSEKTITIELVLQNQCYLDENMEHLTAGETHKTYLIVGDSDNYLLLLTSFKDKDLIKVYDGSITYEIARKRNCEHKIFVHCVSSNFVGIDVQCEFTFKDLETPIHANLQANTKKITQRQTCITDVFKERKRKNENNLNVPQHKEKRRRDSSVLQKFNNLKEPFKETFDILNKNIRQTTMSPENARLHEISYDDNTQIYDMSNEMFNTNKVNVNNITSNTTDSEINIKDSDEEYEYINDDNINKLLDKIESEISEVKKTTRTQVPFSESILDINPGSNNLINETMQSNAPEINIHKNDIIPKIAGKFRSDIDTHATKQRVRKAKNMNSNYSFIDIIQKNDATIDENDNSIVTDNAIGFSTAIKSNIDKYLETIQHGSKDSNDIINEMFPTTDDYNISKRSMVRNVTEPTSMQVDTSCSRLEGNFKSNSLHDNNIEIAAGSDNLNYIAQSSIPDNKLTTVSCQRDKFTPANTIMQSNNLSNNNTFIESLQNKLLIANAIDRKNHENDLNRESNVYDSKINNVLSCINQINEYNNFENKNLMLQDNKISENSNKEVQIINEDKFTSLDQNNDFLDSNKSDKLSRKVFNVDSNFSIAECVSKYSFTATSISVRSSTENFVHIIKKLKVNLDIISKTVPTNKIIINNTINIRSDDYCKAYDRNIVNDTNIPTNAALPSICKAKKSTGSVTPENCEEIDHFKLNQDQRNGMETMIHNTNTKSDIYKVKGNQIISSFDTELKGTTNDGTLQNSENITDVNEYSKDDGMCKELKNLTRIDLDQVTNSNSTAGSGQENIPSQKSEVNKVADILQKYSTILCKNNDSQDFNKGTSSLHRNISRQDLKKSERPFKISDIQKVNVALPESIINKISTDKYSPSKFLIVSNNTSEDERKIADLPFECSDYPKQLEPPTFVNEFEKKYFVNEDIELQRGPKNCQETISDFNIHESMFDPKTLLQCLDNDISNEIIPPPPEFGDKVDDHCVGEITAITSDIENNSGIFQDEGDLELTPCKEIATWTISPRIDNFGYTNHNLIGSCTTMNRSQSIRKKLHIPAVSRRNKLNQFKFSQKNKMKI